MLDLISDLRQRLSENRGGLVTQTWARLTRLARARGVPPDTLDDVAQESLLEAWRSLDRLTAPDGFAPWVDEICRNVCRRYAHRNAREAAHLAQSAPAWSGDARDVDEVAPLVELAPDGASTPEDEALAALSRNELVSLLDQAMGSLPVGARQIIELCHLRETPHADVAARLGIAPGALDTRLSRARRRLLETLNGPLRGQAATLGLPLDDTREDGWLETHVWCPLCANRRMQGMFMAGEGADGGPNLHLRCPDCARRWDRDGTHTMGLIPLRGLRSFRPAWKRSMTGLSRYALDALLAGSLPCGRCAGRAVVSVASAAESPSPTPFHIRTHCPRCGKEEDTTGDLPPLDQIVYWSHPVTRAFILCHDRVRTVFNAPVERDGALALPLSLSDTSSGDHVTALADLSSLRVLALA